MSRPNLRIQKQAREIVNNHPASTTQYYYIELTCNYNITQESCAVVLTTIAGRSLEEREEESSVVVRSAAARSVKQLDTNG